MKPCKKIITRMCINNWGGIGHQVMEFNEYVNLFSGMSGSGKSTVMDAIQVLLYGSLSQNFLNKAADEKNRRTVMTYLRGAQKDGTSNRGNRDFCANLVMEIRDTQDESYRCIGVAFDVRSGDLDINKYTFFSHDGMLDDCLYRNEDGIPLMVKEIADLVKRHQKDPKGRLRGEDINRTYPTNDAYQTALYDQIFGYIDGKRFITMEKSAVALKMSNGVGQFIKDYMFPKSSSEAIEKISRQLGDYTDIRDTVLDMEKRIDLLTAVRESDGRLAVAKAAVLQNEYILKRLRLTAIEEELKRLDAERSGKTLLRDSLAQKRDLLKAEMDRIHGELVETESSLKASDYGKMKEQLAQLDETIVLLNRNCAAWDRFVASLSKWEENEAVYDLVSNAALQSMEDLRDRKADADTLDALRTALRETMEEINEARDNLADERRDLNRELKEKRDRLADWKSGQKSYRNRPGLKEARRELEQALFRETGSKVRVSILADTFDVRDSEWKDAVEGRLGRVKYSLITPPAFSHTAAVLFREMKQFENVDLLHVANIVRDGQEARENALYEAVETDADYVDACLRHFLGRVIKCRTVEELEQVRDGVTADCYSYSNYTLRHLLSKDYRDNACIGKAIPKSRIDQLEAEVKALEETGRELTGRITALEQARSYENLSQENEYYLDLSGAEKERKKHELRREKLAREISELEQGAMRELRERLEETKKRYALKEDEYTRAGNEFAAAERELGTIEADLRNQKAQHAEAEYGFTPNRAEDERIAERLKGRSLNGYRAEAARALESARADAENYTGERQAARMKFNLAYSACGLTGTEESNKPYEDLYQRYSRQYVEEYKEEFERKCREVYRSLRDNVIATIHGDIKAAYRQVREVNRVLGATAFSDSVYKIGITPASNENSQFYEMLTAPELDSKVVNEDDVEGQISFGDDVFERKYEREISLLVEKFIPDRTGDERESAKKRAEMEKFADYRNYLTFNMYEVTVDESGQEKRIPVDEMAGNDSGGEGQNPKYVALFAGFALLFAHQNHRDSRIKIVLLDEAFSKMDKTRSSVCLNYARKLGLQVIICVPDERLMTLVKNVDCVYGFRRYKNQISMLMIDKGSYLDMLEGSDEQGNESEPEQGTDQETEQRQQRGPQGENDTAGMDTGTE